VCLCMCVCERERDDDDDDKMDGNEENNCDARDVSYMNQQKSARVCRLTWVK
jgi:hypothetical protein